MMKAAQLWVKVISLLCLGVMLYFACFHHIDRLPINLWDESLFFMRAFSFLDHGGYLENFNLYEYGIDHRNTKLPFTTFSQVLSLKLFGISTFAVRLPILIIFIVTALYSIKYFQKEFARYGIGVFATIIMVSSHGFVRDHMLRTGDQDVPYACYVLLAVFFFYRFEMRRQTRDLVLFTFWVLAALLTKNLLIGLLLPGLALYSFYRRSIISLLSDRRIYIALVILLGVYAAVICYYENQFPGFFDRMWNYELFGRYTKTIDGHGFNQLYFITGMLKKDFMPFMGILPIAGLLLLLSKGYSRYKHFSVLMISVFVCYLLGISLSSTRVFWYSAPLYPIGSVVLALSLFPSLDREGRSAYLRYLPLLSFLLLLVPFSSVVLANNNPQTIYQSSKLGSFLENMMKQKPDLKTFTFFDNSFGTGAGFYIEQAKAEGYRIDFTRKVDFEVGEYVALCRHKLVPKIEELHEIEKVYADKDCVIYTITSTKKK